MLREFPSLRHLTLSWGMWCDSYDVSKSKIAFMMAWLLNALQAENASVSLQLCYKQRDILPVDHLLTMPSLLLPLLIQSCHNHSSQELTKGRCLNQAQYLELFQTQMKWE